MPRVALLTCDGASNLTSTHLNEPVAASLAAAVCNGATASTPTAPAGMHLPCRSTTVPHPQAPPAFFTKTATAAALAALMAGSPLLHVALPPPAYADYQDRLEALERRKALLQKAYVPSWSVCSMYGTLLWSPPSTTTTGVKTR